MQRPGKCLPSVALLSPETPDHTIVPKELSVLGKPFAPFLGETLSRLPHGLLRSS
jgi:hypothetical protein